MKINPPICLFMSGDFFTFVLLIKSHFKFFKIMPNQIINRLTIIGTHEEVSLVLEKIKGDGQDKFIDFNKISPMPKELEGTSCPTQIISQEEYDKQQKRIENNELMEHEIKHGLSRGITQEMSNEFIENFGFDNWHDWSLSNWGTKWNAYEQYMEDDNTICFNTAWATPFEVIQELSFMFPHMTFQVDFYDDSDDGDDKRYVLMNGNLLSD